MAVIAYSVPVGFWIFWRKKTGASAFPLIAGIVAYILISFARGGVRAVVFTDSLRENKVAFYIVSALISGVCEELGRYIVFRRVMTWSSDYKDCVTYGFAHSATESFLLSHVLENDLFDSIIEAISFAVGILFSVAMSVLVFTAVKHCFSKTQSRILMLSAVLFHTAADIIPGGYFTDFLSFEDYEIIYVIFIALCCFIAFRVYKHYGKSSDFN